MQLALFTDMPKRPPKIVDVNYSEGFERFWMNFPRQRRTDKPGSWRSYQRAVGIIMGRRNCDASTAEQYISKRAADYAISDKGQGPYAVMPTTWLNQHRWDDDDDAWMDGPPVAPAPKPKPKLPIAKVQDRRPS